MDEIAKLIKELGVGIKERFGDPFLRYFWLFYLAKNWKPIAVLFFGRGTVEDRIEYVKIHYAFPYDFCSGYLQLYQTVENIFFPLGFAILFFFCYPFLKGKILQYWENRNIEIQNDQLERQKKVALDAAQSSKLYNKVKNLELEIKNLKDDSLNLTKFAELVILGASVKYKDSIDSFVITTLRLDDLQYLKEGSWVIYSKNQNQVKILKRTNQLIISENDTAALVLEVLESCHVLLKIKGHFDFNKFQIQKPMKYRSGHLYLLTEDKPDLPTETKERDFQDGIYVCFCLRDNLVSIASIAQKSENRFNLKSPDEKDEPLVFEAY